MTYRNLTTLDPLHGSPRKIDGLDGIRAIAVLLILVFHASIPLIRKSPVDPFGVTVSLGWLASIGFLGVAIFFVLSGFLVSRPFLLAIEGKNRFPNPKHFLRNRACRILPGYYVALFIVFVLPSPVCQNCAERPLRQLLTHMIFTHTFYRDTFFGIIGPMWAVAIEVHFYLLLPLVMYLAYRSRIKPGYTIAGLGLLSIALTAQAPKTSTDLLPYSNIAIFFSVFMIGVVFSWIHIKTNPVANRLSNGLSVIVLMFLVLYFLIPAIRTSLTQHHLILRPIYEWPTIPFLFGLLIFLISFKQSLLGRLLELWPFRLIGLLSYGIFLYHYPVQLAIRELFHLATTTRMGVAQLIFLSFVLSFLLAAVSYRYIELPALKTKFLGVRK
jgi:peptidoglycan/LPS O-acetylase OafA/YrhL